MRSAVDLPHPEGPTDHELAVGDLQVDALDGLEAVGVALGDVAQRDRGHALTP